MFLQPQWPAPPQIKAFTSLRQGGASLPPYASFNLALHVDDHEETVKANRQHLKQLFDLPAEPIWLNQIHSATVVAARPENRGKEADASFTREPQQVCAVLTADCLPVLLCDQEGTQVAALHAGWRGLAQGIIAQTLQTFEPRHQTVLAWLGPAIGPRQFEVGKDVYQAFCALDDANQTAFTPYSAATWLADIYELARLQLHALGVSRIYGGNYCTYTEADKFFSYRRDRGKTGRMASLIWLEER